MDPFERLVAFVKVIDRGHTERYNRHDQSDEDWHYGHTKWIIEKINREERARKAIADIVPLPKKDWE
jgi:hypothetical protein